MGNCNSESEIKQKCTGCGYKKCDCTAGLDRICGRCDPSWKYNIPGTYDAQYNAWMAANPRPVQPVFDPQPPLNSMDFVCTQCTQCQDFSGITAGGTLSIKDPSQVMTCIGKMQEKVEKDAAASGAAELATTAQEESSNKTIIILAGASFLLFMFIILIAVLFSMRSFGGAYDDPDSIALEIKE